MVAINHRRPRHRSVARHDFDPDRAQPLGNTATRLPNSCMSIVVRLIVPSISAKSARLRNCDLTHPVTMRLSARVSSFAPFIAVLAQFAVAAAEAVLDCGTSVAVGLPHLIETSRLCA